MTMTTTRHIADITDPTTGNQIHLEAATQDELEYLLEEHLATTYPLPPTTPIPDTTTRPKRGPS